MSDFEKYLSMEDLLRIELAQERVEKGLLAVVAKQQEDKLDELSMHKLQLESQVRLLDLALRRKSREADIARLKEVHQAAGAKYAQLKEELGPKYGVDDWAKVSYDDETGRINALPVKEG